MSHITNKVHDQSHRTRYIRLDAPAQIRHFAQIPSFLFDEPAFQPLTNEGKLLYTMLLRRSELSRKHRWTDKQGCVFIYYTIEETTELLHCSRQKAVNTLRELQRSGLLEIRRQGCGRPNRLYPRFFDEAPNTGQESEELTGAYDNLRHKALRDWEAEEVPESVLGFPDNGEPDNGFPAYGFPNAGSFDPAPREYDSQP